MAKTQTKTKDEIAVPNFDAFIALAEVSERPDIEHLLDYEAGWLARAAFEVEKALEAEAERRRLLVESVASPWDEIVNGIGGDRRAVAKRLTVQELRAASEQVQRRIDQDNRILETLEQVKAERFPVPTATPRESIMFVFGGDKSPVAARNDAVRRLAKAVRLHRPHDIEGVVADLTREFPHAKSAVRALAEADLKSADWGADVLPRPILLVGDPGCGKSTLARRYQERLGFPCMTHALGGATDTHMLTGTRHTWMSSAPSLMLEFIARHECGNVAFVMDELDKLPEVNRNGDVRATLLSLLEPSESARFMDHFAEVECDFSRIRWVFTANNIENIPGPLKSRCHVVRVQSPTVEHAPALANVMIEDIAATKGLDPEWFPTLDQEEISALVGVLSAKKRINLKTGKSEIVRIDLRNLRPMVEKILDLRVQTSWGRA